MTISRFRRPLLFLGLGMALAALSVTWFVVTVGYPRLANPEVIEELTSPISFREGAGADQIRSQMAILAETFLSRPDNAGIVIGATRGGERHLVVRGVASKKNPHPVDDHSLFEIGSVSKTFTGVALAQAVLSGDIELDQPISSLVPERNALPEMKDTSITVAHLATHSSGLPRSPTAIPAWSPMFRDNPHGELSESELFESLAVAVEEGLVPGSYSYSNFGFALLAHLLQEAAAVPYARLIEDGICEPLGMDSTRVVLPDSMRSRLVDGHSFGRIMPHYINYKLPGAGGIVSSANDLLTFIEAHMELQANPLQEALDLATTARRPGSEGEELGLAWWIETKPDGTRVVSHLGATVGFWSYLGFSPELDVGVVVLANSNDPSVRVIGDRLLAALMVLAGGEAQTR